MKRNYERRARKDRRKNKQLKSFPLHDSNGKLITKERRILLDRRIEGVENSLSSISQKEFFEFWEKNQKLSNQ